MKCPYCKVKTYLKEGVIDGFSYEYFKCPKCKEGYLDFRQLSKLAAKYRKMKKGREVRFMKWGNSLAVRVPSRIARDLEVKEGDTGYMVKDERGIRIIPD